eukprot:2784912-Amphidinium_carterae.1
MARRDCCGNISKLRCVAPSVRRLGEGSTKSYLLSFTVTSCAWASRAGLRHSRKIVAWLEFVHSSDSCIELGQATCNVSQSV